MTDTVESILKRNLLSITSSRKKILGLFLGNAGALSHSDIEKKAGGKFDRVTVYRTLQVFLEKGVIHNIPSSDNSIRYALCKDDCTEGNHHDNHVHFICSDCGNTICLDNVTVPPVRLPNDFTATQVEVIVSGICKACK
jgi:Fur family transcriptional regulator, ferric uptake regulator